MRIFSTTIVILALLAIGGCDPANDPVVTPVVIVDHHHAPEIRYFSLLAAPGATAFNYGAAPITPYLDNGYFQIEWEMATEGSYQIDMYVSNDPYLDPEDPLARDDVHFKQLYRGLTILEHGGPDERGFAQVKFLAQVFAGPRDCSFTELSEFLLDGAGWRYFSGEPKPVTP